MDELQLLCFFLLLLLLLGGLLRLGFGVCCFKGKRRTATPRAHKLIAFSFAFHKGKGSTEHRAASTTVKQLEIVE